MGTKAQIIIRIKDEDHGRKIRFNPSKMPHQVEIHPNQTNPLPEVELSGKYLTCYHGLDSFPGYLGKELKRNYDTYDKVLNLVSGGAYETILGERKWNGERMPDNEHCIRNCLSVELFDWEDCKPECFDILSKYDYLMASYLYLFREGKWWVKNDLREEPFRVLKF